LKRRASIDKTAAAELGATMDTVAKALRDRIIS
jgi:hypothetical protein